MSNPTDKPEEMTLEKLGALQFSPDECERILELPSGAVSGDQARMAEWYRGKMKGEAALWASVFAAAKSGDVKAQELFLERCRSVRVDVTQDEPAPRGRKAAKGTTGA